MNGIKYVFTRRFSMAHRLISGTSPKCAIPHGHNEIVSVHLMPKSADSFERGPNIIEPFDMIKADWHAFIDDRIDHSFQVSETDPIIRYFVENEQEKLDRLVVTPGDPTTEILCACLMSKIQSMLLHRKSLLYCHEISVQETPTNTVQISGADAYSGMLPKGDFWWNRPDSSINDFTRFRVARLS